MKMKNELVTQPEPDVLMGVGVRFPLSSLFKYFKSGDKKEEMAEMKKTAAGPLTAVMC